MLDNEPTVGDTTTDQTTEHHTSAAESAAPRRRASRPAGPPPEPEEIPAAPPAPAQAFAGTAVAGPVTTTTRTRKAKVVVPKDEETAEQERLFDQPAEKPKRVTRRKAKAVEPVEVKATEAAEAPAETVADSLVEPEPVKPVRRTRARRKAAAEETPAETPAETVAEAPVAAAETVEEAPVRRRRTRKKDEEAGERSSAMSAAEAQVAAAILLAMPAEEPLDDEPAGEDLEDLDEESAPRVHLVADPFGLVARPADVPSVTFQPPAAIFQPLFQAPDPFAPPAPRPAPAAPAPQVEPEPEEEPVAVEAEETEETEDEESAEGSRRRRRRRGGRGRGRSRDLDEQAEEDGAEEEPAEEEAPAAAEEAEEAEAGSSRRRRRRRRRGSEDVEPLGDEPPNTVTRIRAPRAGRTTTSPLDEVQGFRGSTRLEAKKQRRREGREMGRRRPPIITESEFLARREAVERVMVVRRHGGRTQIAVLEDGVLVEHYVDRESSQSYVGNVYLGKVQNVLPSMEAAFVDIGKGRNAVLYAGEVNFDTAGLEGQPRRIEAALKSGQPVLVQVTKDPMGHKGARLTSQISLPGRYLVYVPDGSMTGISRKLPDKERTRLKQILRKVMPENAGVIVRTAAEGASEEELGRDVARLSAQWEAIQRKAKSASPPELLSGEPDLTVRVVRDVFNEDFASLVVSGEEVWRDVDDYVRHVAPHLVERLSRWAEPGDVFAAYRVDEQIAKAMERKVWLPSGGSLVIDRTEAMTVVDVNTGKFTGHGGNLEETVTRNNLEAAEEIVRQLRLRDVGGIIVIDFIDMVLESNRDLVLRRLLECLARDRTKHQVAEVTSLGLVQMTRKRVGQGLLEAFSTPCDCCHGRGLIISTEPVEGRPEPRGTQGKMAIEKTVSEKLGESSVVAAAEDGRESVTDAVDEGQPRARRRSRRSRAAD
ncbi:Rne/Rng family ribonuclease [Acrocarpospora catenulata]|uniref:Rne/Rng family ribonuclease n=1 Tax=Acrocarpospora catenulata TaxID=2836182 RepID=UPI001BDB2280|nr:Rne/Rng family ribonuclease [Acrocarpospora catenulata]